MKVKDLMTKAPQTLTTHDSLARARQVMTELKIRQLPIVDDNNCVIGIITKKDVYAAGVSSLTQHMGKRQELLEQTIKVDDVMTKDVLTISVDELVSTAAAQIVEKRIGALPVTENGKLVGILSSTDILAVAVQLLQDRGF